MTDISAAQLSSLSAGINQSFGALQAAIAAQVYAENLPLIGDDLAGRSAAALQAVNTMKGVLVAALNTLAQSAAQTTQQVQAALDAALAAAGFAGAPVAVAASAGTVTLDFGETFTGGVNLALADDLGLAGLDVQTAGSAHADVVSQLDLTVGVDGAGFFIDTSGANQITLDLDATVTGFSTDLTMAGQEFNAGDAGSSLNATITIDLQDTNNDGRLRLAELSGDLLDAALTGTAHVDVQLDPAGAADMGLLFSTDLVVNWSFASATIDPGDANTGFGNRPTVQFGDVAVDLGAFMERFVSPLLSQIEAVLAPIQPVLEVLDASIGLLEGFPGGVALFDATGDGRVTLLDILKLADSSLDLGPILDFIAMAQSVSDWAGFLEGRNFADGSLSIGDFTLGTAADIRSLGFTLANAPVTFGGLADSLDGILGTLGGAGWDAVDTGSGLTGVEILQDMLSGGVFDLPVLTDPTEIIALLLGGDADLAVVDLPEVSVSASDPTLLSFPIIPGLNIEVGGGVSLNFDLGFGFNTRGLTTLGLDPLDGFFIIDAEGAEVSMSATVTLGAALDFLIASVYGGGDITGTIEFDLLSETLGSTDGRLYLDEFLTALQDNPFSIFATSGSITAGFSAYAEVFWGEIWHYDSPRILLGSFGFDQIDTQNIDFSAWFPATKTGQTLHLNIGASTVALYPHAPIADEGQTVWISEPASGNDVLVEIAGVLPHEYDGITLIEGDAGLGDDTVLLDTGLAIAASLGGGDGADVLGGGAAGDTLEGGRGRDVLFGNGGVDHLNGDDGNDLFFGGAGGDFISGGAGTDLVSYAQSAAGVTINLRIAVQFGGEADGDRLSGIEVVEGSGFGDSLTGAGDDGAFSGRDGNDTIRSGNGAQELLGNAGDDWLFALGGNDTLVGGLGDDYYSVTSIFDVVDENRYGEIEYPFLGGQDTVIASVDYTLDGGADQVEVLILTGTAIRGTGNIGLNTITGNGQANWLSGMESADTIYGGAGGDTLYGGTGIDEAYGGDGKDELHGGADTGADLLYGGANDDLYYVETGDIVQDELFAGDDTIIAESDFALATMAEIERIEALAGNILFASENIDLTGNLRAQELVGNSADNVLEGRGGADTIDGGDGVDTASYALSAAGVTVDLAAASQSGGDAADDVLSNIENLTGSAFNDTLRGRGAVVLALSEANSLDGGAGDDALYGYGHNDTLLGGDGNDSLYGGLDADALYGGGHDDVLGGGVGDDSLWGDAGDDDLAGEAGNDSLNGGAGDDTLTGGTGNDTLTVTAGDVIVEAAAAGTDLVLANESYVLAAGVAVETLRAAAGAGALALTGNEVAQRLDGNEADNTLQGRGGADTLDGGAGFDTVSYYLSGAGVQVQLGAALQHGGEAEGDVLSWVEAVRGSAHADTITGRETVPAGQIADNLYWGEGGNDIITDLAGADSLYGGVGDDRLTVDGARNLVAGGIGNDVLTSGQTTLAGQGDTLVGGMGDDLYILRSVETVIDENFLNEISGDGGHDIVLAAVSWSLDTAGQAGVEDLLLTGSARNGTGNGLANILAGTALANRLSGLGGNDLLNAGRGGDAVLGGEGRDTLIGAAGGDRLYGERGVDSLRGDSGNDSLFGGDGTDVLLGGDGDDALNGGAQADILTGGLGNDLLVGAGGNDVLNGNPGNDTLIGGGGGDVFWFNTGGQDLVQDFTDGSDLIRIAPALVPGFASLVITQSGADTVITAAGLTLRLDNVAASDLTAADFSFL